MPWEHCDETIPDDATCPVCGVSKEQWTCQWNVTRDFVVTRRPLIKILLVDPAGDPVPAEPYSVELPDGSVVDGELDEGGYTKVVAGERGTATVTFPQRRVGSVELVVEDSGPGDGADSEPGASEPDTGEPGQSGDAGPGGGTPEETGEAGAADDDSTPPSFACRTGRRQHRFCLANLRIRLRRGGEPLAEQPFSLEVSDRTIEGTTDADGLLRALVPTETTRATVTVGDAAPLALEIGLDPHTEVSGVQARLRNLGFPCPVDGELGETTRAALRRFQERASLEVTGEPDQATQDRLREEHGC
jgi:hypothetical protein